MIGMKIVWLGIGLFPVLQWIRTSGLADLEKDRISGNVSYVPENHEYMTKIRAEKVKRVQNYIPDIETEFAQEGDLLVVGWGGTYGSLHSAVKQINEEGYSNIGFAHFQLY